jgi:hypothetical protein
MNTKIYLLIAITILLCIPTTSIKSVDSFEELGIFHCENFPIELLYRLATGQLAEIYGPDYRDLDCYIRQFVNKGN